MRRKVLISNHTVNNNSSFLNEGVAHCPEKRKRKRKEIQQNCVTINGSCAFVYLAKHLISLKRFQQMMKKTQRIKHKPKTTLTNQTNR